VTDKASRQQRYCCKQGGTLLSSAVVRYQPRFRQDKHFWAFVCYLLLYNFIQQRLGSDIATIPACSNTRPLYAILAGTLINNKQFNDRP